MNKRQEQRQEQPAPARQDASRWMAAGAALLLVAGPLTPGEAAAEHGVHYFWTVGWLLLLAAPWALALLKQQAAAVRWRASDVLLVGGCLWLAATAAWGGGQANLRSGLNMCWFWVGAAACLAALRQLEAGARQTLIVILVAAAAAQGLHGVFQYAVVLPGQVRHYEQLSEPGKQQFLRESGVGTDVGPGSPTRVQFENRLSSSEPYATHGLGNSLAGVLAPWLIVALGLMMSRLPRSQFVFCLLASLAIAACLVLTKSRTAWLAAAAGVLGLAVWDLRGEMRLGWKLPLAAAIVVVIGAVGGYAVGALDREVLTQAVLSLTYRVEYWRSTLGMIADHLLLGCGSGNFQDYYLQYKLPTASETVADPHNFLLELAATGGLPAALLMAAGWFAQLWPGSGSQQSPETSSSKEGSNLTWWAAMAGLVVGWFVSVMFGFPHDLWFVAPVTWTFGTGLLLVAWLIRPWCREKALSPTVVKIGLAVVLINLLAAGGLSFWSVLQSVLLLGVASDTSREHRMDLGRGRLLTVVAALLLTLAAVQLTGLAPVLRSQLLVEGATASGEFSETERLLQSAAEADPWSGEPWRLRAQMRGDIGQFDDTTERAIAEAMKRDKRNHRLWTDLGRWRLQSSEFGRWPASWRQSVDAYRRAYQLGPQGPSQARLAWSLHWGPDSAQPEAAELAAAALQWDENHPHQEQRLRHLTLPGPDSPVNAEQGMRSLRNPGGS